MFDMQVHNFFKESAKTSVFNTNEDVVGIPNEKSQEE